MKRFVAGVVLGSFVLASVYASAAAAPAGRREAIYDEKSDAKEDIAAAVGRAARDNKRVLLVFGGNWCGWCNLLHDLFKDDAGIRGVLRSEYEVVNVDVRRAGDVLKHYEIKPQGYPYLAVLDGQDQLVTQQETGSLEEGRKHDPAKVKAFLEKWKPEPLHAKRVLDDALATAGREDKRVFLKFSAQSCGWCVKFDQLLARPEVDAALRADLVVVTIDVDRMTGVADVAKRYQERDVPTSNWYAVLAPDGKTLSRSEIPMPDPQPGRSIGFPTQPEEVEHVVKMLTDGRKRMTDEQAAAVCEAFTSAAASAKDSPRK